MTMFGTHTPGSDDRKRLKTALASVGLVLALAAGLLAAGAGPATAQEYYNNSSSETGTPYATGWFAGLEDATMDDIITMALRLGAYIIGSGTLGPGGYSGVLLLGLVVTAVFVGAVAGTDIGAAGASVVSLAVAYALVEVGLAPGWLRIVLLFLLGIVAAVVVIRVAR